MAEPVSTTAAAAVAAPAAASAAPAAASSAPAAGAGGASSGGAPGSGANSPAYGLKSQGSPLDTVATQPGMEVDVGAIQRTLGCHDGSAALPKPISPQTPGDMPNIADHWFNGPGQHGQIRLPEIESRGDQLLRQPDTLPGESVREPLAADRARHIERPTEAPDTLGPQPEQRATVEPPTDPTAPPGQPGTPSAPTPPEPSAQDFAQTPTPGAPPKPSPPPVEPVPDAAATAPSPGRNLPDTTADPSAAAEFSTKVEALHWGAVSGIFGPVLEGWADLGDLLFELAPVSDKPGAREAYEEAREEFRTFSGETARQAQEKDEAFGTAGMAIGVFGPEVFSPGSKAKAAGTAVATGKVVVEVGKKKVKKKIATKTVSSAVEKSAAYKRLVKAKKIWKKPVTESQGSWFQKWVTKKDEEYVGLLKNGKTVQIDDLATAADGKLVLVEVKFMKKGTEIPDSGHVKFAKEKVEHLERLLDFYKQNRDTVSHIEITVSREEAAQIYAELAAASPKLADYVGTIIRFGTP